ncbi:MAG: MFS transporter [Vampirovibrionales bacterium]|nr:MFS transporter [Vampirovibrionales bacterium]
MTPPSAPALETPPSRAVNEGYRSVLKNRTFVLLWLGQVFSQLGDRVVFVIFIAAITAYYGANDRYNSYLYIAFTIPAILLTAIAGVFVDRWPRRLTLVTTNLCRAALLAFLPMAAHQGLMGIYALAFLVSSATQFFVPAESATIPLVVRKTQLMTANSLFTTTMMGSVIFGFALGDPLINIFSLEQVHWAVVGLFLLAGGVLCFVKPPGDPSAARLRPTQRDVLNSLRRFGAEMHEGVAYILERRVILKTILKLALLFSVVVAMCILFISFARDFLYDNPAVASRKFAYIVTFSGIGMSAGALVVGRFFRDAGRQRMAYGGFLAIGTFLLAMAQMDWIPKHAMLFGVPAQSVSLGGGLQLFLERFPLTLRMALTYGLSTLMGVAAAFVAIPLQSLLHEVIPDDKRGKIMGVQFTLLSTASTLPVLAAGLGVEYFGTAAMLNLMGAPVFAVGLFGLMRLIARARERRHHAHSAAEDW